jgi:hypothetical protein
MSSGGNVTAPGWLQWLAQAQGLSLAVAEVFGLPSTVLYLLEVGLMMGHWRALFNSPFYQFFLVRAISVSQSPSNLLNKNII